jgi:hypothetical protein
VFSCLDILSTSHSKLDCNISACQGFQKGLLSVVTSGMHAYVHECIRVYMRMHIIIL